MRYSTYDITAFTNHGNPAPLNERTELLEKLLKVEFAICESDPQIANKETSSWIGSFSSEYTSAPDEAERIIKEFCKEHQDIIVQMDYECDEDNTHIRTRFYRNESEFVEREYRWPEFKELVTPDNPVEDESSELHQYDVAFKIDGRFYAHIIAPDIKTAINLGKYAYQDADFGVLECIDAETIHVEDENGNYHDPE